MQKDDKLRRYSAKDYSEVVDFPVELIDRDGVRRQYSFEESLEVYQRRIETASWRYDDADVVAAEIRHCTNRLQQIERSFLLRHRGGAARLDKPEVQQATGLGEADALLRQFYSATAAAQGLRWRRDVELPLRVTPVPGAGESAVWIVSFGNGPGRHLLYVHPWNHKGGDGPDAGREPHRRWVEVLQRAAIQPGPDVERLLYHHESAVAGYTLTGADALPAELLALTDPVSSASLTALRSTVSDLDPGPEEGGQGPGDSDEFEAFGMASTPPSTEAPPEAEGGRGAEAQHRGAALVAADLPDDDPAEPDPDPPLDAGDTWGPDPADGLEGLPPELVEDEDDEPLAAGEGELLQAARALRAGSAEVAIELLRSAVEANPYSRKAYRLLVPLLDAAGQRDDAELYARLAEVHLPGDAVIVHLRSLLHLLRGRLPEALDGFERVLQLDPELHEARFFAGLVHATRGSLDQAIPLLAASVQGERLGERARLALSWARRRRRLARRARGGLLLLMLLTAVSVALQAWVAAVAGVAMSTVGAWLVGPVLHRRTTAEFHRMLAELEGATGPPRRPGPTTG